VKPNSYPQIYQELTAQGVELLAVSKYQPLEKIQALYAQGQRAFGENRVQELLEKIQLLPADIRWDLIGHLQTNKVKFIAPFIHRIQSVDSWRLLQEIDKQAAKYERVIPCLLQIYIAQEDTKFGLDPQEATELLQHPDFQQLKNVQIQGLMGMATNTPDRAQILREFQTLKTLFDTFKTQFFAHSDTFKTLSMGMSSDYDLGIATGANMVRLGSLVF
jgi:PLP dependent protein